MDYIFGPHANRPELEPITWNPDARNSVNPHFLLCGGSGAGKTTLLLNVASYLERVNKHIFIFDLKGDMVVKDQFGNKVGNYIEFTAWNSPYGLNPFEFDSGVTQEELSEIIESGLEPTKEQLFKIRNSGPKVQVDRLIDIIKKNFMPTMGAFQKNVLMYLLSDVYRYKGFIYDDYTTWQGDLPSVKDVIELIQRIRSELSGGYFTPNIDSHTQTFVSNIQRSILKLMYADLVESSPGEAVKLARFSDKVFGPDSLKENPDADVEGDTDGVREDLENEVAEQNLNNQVSADQNGKNPPKVDRAEIKEQAFAALDEYLKWGAKDFDPNYVMQLPRLLEEDGIELDKYASKKVLTTMETVESYIKALDESGVFHSVKPPVKAGLNVVNISGLDIPIQRVIVDVWIGKVFMSCKIRGNYAERPNKSRGKKCDTFVMVDESKLIAGSSREKNDPYSYLNRIATEARGFGLGLVVASQSADHMPNEFLKNFDQQVILNTGIADFEAVRKAFGLDKPMLEFTQQGWGNALIKTGKKFSKAKLIYGGSNGGVT